MTVGRGGVGISQGGRIGRASRHQSHQGIIIQFTYESSYGSAYQERQYGDDNAVSYPDLPSVIHDRIYEALAGSQSHGRQEKRYADFSEHQVGTLGGIGHDLEFISEPAD